MKVFVDIDETICSHPQPNTGGRDYKQAIPNHTNISAVNKLFKQGHQITYWTARGSASGEDWGQTTQDQLKQWGALYHNLLMGKPDYDIYIDDKSINTSEWEKQGRGLPVIK